MSMVASPPRSEPLAVVVMGVTGCGKSTAGEMLAKRLGATFIEGDRLHPEANIRKMSAGTPLDDADREPWLASVGNRIGESSGRGVPVVAACSALKRRYRDSLRVTSGCPLVFVFLDGSRALIAARLSGRTGHFMPASLLDSQFASLERPDADEAAIRAELALPFDQMIEEIVFQLHVPQRREAAAISR